MKRIIKLCFITMLALVSCEENFSPKQDFKEQYIANLVIGIGSESSKFAAQLHLASSYDVEGILPDENDKDPSIVSAEAKLFFNEDTKYQLKQDSSIIYHPQIPDSILWAQYNRYGNPFVTFNINEVPIRYSPIQLEIKLDNGKSLNSSTQFPRGVFLEYNYDYPHGFTTNVNTFKFGEYWEVKWDADDNNMYYTNLVLNYHIENESGNFYDKIEIPIEIIDKKQILPGFNYPGKVRYSFKAIEAILSKLSEDITEANNIILDNFTLQVVELNEDLSRYYSSISGFLDKYSVRLDEQIYSNINGGIGIFGAYKVTEVKHFIDRNFASSFGFKTNH
jgi:hypothetical protein